MNKNYNFKFTDTKIIVSSMNNGWNTIEKEYNLKNLITNAWKGDKEKFYEFGKIFYDISSFCHNKKNKDKLYDVSLSLYNYINYPSDPDLLFFD